MEAVAARVHEGIQFKGVAFEQERAQLLLQLPSDGVDIQDEPVYWVLPDGSCKSWSVRYLANAADDELVHATAKTLQKAYHYVAQELGYHTLGMASDEEIAALVAEPGALKDESWNRFTWHRPIDETCPCWWVANGTDQDQSADAKLICRSLTCCRLEIQASRCATVAKLKTEWTKRVDANVAAVARLKHHRDLWQRALGPDPEKLARPSEVDLHAAQKAAAALQRMLEKCEIGKEHEHVEALVEECVAAAETLRLATWDAIWRERFSVTPEGLFNELARTADSLLARTDADDARRQVFLAEAMPGEGDGQYLPPSSPIRKDKYGLDLEEFKDKSGHAPQNWHKSVRQASAIIMDDMRALLELHYDDVHVERWRKRHGDDKERAPERRGAHKVFSSVAQGRRKKLNQSVELPDAVKGILRRPEDELSMHKLEKLRSAIGRIVEGERQMSLGTVHEIEQIAQAVEASRSEVFGDEVGEDLELSSGKLLIGMRLQLDDLSESRSVRKRRRTVAKGLRELKENDALQVLARPLRTVRQPPLDPFAQDLLRSDHIKDVAKKLALSKEKLLDKMLLVLFDALFLAQSEEWTQRKVANAPADETYELARWWALGQNVGKNAIFDGMCSMCGALLYGVQNKSSALSNKCSGPPCNRDGTAVTRQDGAPDTEAQPPFLLRYSPQLFAKEAPEMFSYDAATNRLCIQPGMPEPWIRPSHPNIPKDDPNTWLYCTECRQRWFRKVGEKQQSHVPFRDKASQNWLKQTYRRGTEKETVDVPAHELEEEPPSLLPSDSESKATDDEEMPGDEEEEWTPEMPTDAPARPSVEEYQAMWDSRKAWHARAVRGPFSRDNLVPCPEPQLWQDCPYVPFDELKSTEAQSRLSVCRPHSNLEPASCAKGPPRYAHNTGGVLFRRWAPLQISNMMGLILNKTSGKAAGITPAEQDKVHECLTWGRQPGNNKVLTFFGTVFESFYRSCSQLMGRFKSVLPEGCLRARIRATRRESHNVKEGCLGDTLGDEAHGMVIVDGGGFPMKYDSLTTMADVVATQTSRIEIDIPGEGGVDWSRTGSGVNVADDASLNEKWREGIVQGAEHLREETYVRFTEPHYDAKAFPHMHPYGTGSVFAEPGSGSPKNHAKNRLTLIQSWFRNSPLWGFWFLNRIIVADLFFTNRKRQEAGRRGASAGTEKDPITKLYGAAEPSHIPETSAWWERQAKDLNAITDDSENGLFQAMVTITHNDSCPEMLAAVRRGPFATPTDEELIEYLLPRKPRDRQAPEFEKHSLEHVLSYQRRVYNLKNKFMVRNKRTPLGRLKDFWDRTEAQMRAALHAHILVWFHRRDPQEQADELKAQGKEPYKALPPREKSNKNAGPKQRPRSETVADVAERDYQEDNMYHNAEMARVETEMIRPYVAGEAWGGYGWQHLRIAGLARVIQTRLYLHRCSTAYCLKNRSTCRFFFPWPHQPFQQHDENMDRVACQRRCEEDDQWVNPHNRDMMMFSPATTHVLPFDPHHGCDDARLYAGKYAAKAEKWYYLDTEGDGVRNLLKCRTVGVCMAHNRLLGFHVVRSTRPVVWTPCEFIPGRGSRTPRTPWHVEQFPEYPDPHFYLGEVAKYLYRAPELRHLRIEQYHRYFAQTEEGCIERTIEDTCCEESMLPEPDHKNYDEWSETVAEGKRFKSFMKHVEGARRRHQSRLAVNRTATLEPIGASRETFYQNRLLLSLSWYCDSPPKQTLIEGGKVLVAWTVTWTPPPEVEAQLQPKHLVLGPEEAVSFEAVCAEYERDFCRPEHGLECACCALETKEFVCKSCTNCIGFHWCTNNHLGQGKLRWRKGSLFGGDLDIQRALFNLHRKRVPLEKLKVKADECVAADLLTSEKAHSIMQVIEQERDRTRTTNEVDSDGEQAEQREHVSSRLSPAELAAELDRREALMQVGSSGITDQWRVYNHIVTSLRTGAPLRLMVQASAGTGKSFLLTTVYLWCIVNGKKAKACAPTGIAAANVEIEGTSLEIQNRNASNTKVNAKQYNQANLG